MWLNSGLSCVDLSSYTSLYATWHWSTSTQIWSTYAFLTLQERWQPDYWISLCCIHDSRLYCIVLSWAGLLFVPLYLALVGVRQELSWSPHQMVRDSLADLQDAGYELFSSWGILLAIAKHVVALHWFLWSMNLKVIFRPLLSFS